MNRKIAILLAVLVLVLGVVAVLIIGRPDAQSAVEPTETLTESGTIVIDKDKDISVQVGVEKVDPEKKENGEGSTPVQTSTPEKTPAPEQTPAPMPEDPAKCSYEVFYALSPEQKDEFLKSFESYDAFYEWLIAAQEEFRIAHPDIEIGPGGVIDLSKLVP